MRECKGGVFAESQMRSFQRPVAGVSSGEATVRLSWRGVCDDDFAVFRNVRMAAKGLGSGRREKGFA